MSRKSVRSPKPTSALEANGPSIPLDEGTRREYAIEGRRFPSQKRCRQRQHVVLLVHEYELANPTHCFTCQAPCDDILRHAGARRAGLSVATLNVLLPRLSSTSAAALQREHDEWAIHGVTSTIATVQGRPTSDEVWLIDGLTSAALIAQRDSFVEQLHQSNYGIVMDKHHGGPARLRLAVQIARDFNNAARWASLFELGLIDVPGVRDEWQLVRWMLESAAKAIKSEPEKVAKLADRHRGRGDRLGRPAKIFKQNVAKILSRCMRLDSERAAGIFKTVCGDALGKPPADPKRELRMLSRPK